MLKVTACDLHFDLTHMCHVTARHIRYTPHLGGVGDVDTLYLFVDEIQVWINRCLKVAGYGFIDTTSQSDHSTQHRARRHEHTNKQALNTREDKRHLSVQDHSSSPVAVPVNTAPICTPFSGGTASVAGGASAGL